MIADKLLNVLLKESRIYQNKAVKWVEKYFSFLLQLFNCLYVLSRILKRSSSDQQNFVFYVLIPVLLFISFINDFLNNTSRYKIITSQSFLLCSLEYTLRGMEYQDDLPLQLQYSYFTMILIKQNVFIQKSNLQMSSTIFLFIYMIVRVVCRGLIGQNLYQMGMLCVMSLFLDLDRVGQEKYIIQGDNKVGQMNQAQKKLEKCKQQYNSFNNKVPDQQRDTKKNNSFKVSLNQLFAKQGYKNVEQSVSLINGDSYLPSRKEEVKLKEIEESNQIFANPILQIIQTGVLMINNEFQVTFCNTEMKKRFSTNDQYSILEKILEIKVKEKIRVKSYKLIPFFDGKGSKLSSFADKDQQIQLSPATNATFTLAGEYNYNQKDSLILSNQSYQSPAASQTNSEHKQNNQETFLSVNRNKSRSQTNGIQKRERTLHEMTIKNKQNLQIKPKIYKKQISEGESNKSKWTNNEKTLRQGIFPEILKKNLQSPFLQCVNSNNLGDHDETSISQLDFSNNPIKNLKYINQKYSQGDKTYFQKQGSIQASIQEKQPQLSYSDFQLKQCIIPQKVLQIFELEEFTIYDLLKMIFEQQDRAFYNKYYSQNDLQDSVNQLFQGANQRNRSESLIKNMNLQQNDNTINQDELKYQENNGCISYYLDKNNLIINIKQIEQKDLSQLQLRIGFYIFKNTLNIEKGYQKSFVIIEIFDQGQLNVNMQEKDITEYKNRMLASISHELRTPLNCSITMLQILFERFEELQQNGCDQEIQDINQSLVKPALFSNQLLLNIINDILDYAQINAGKFKLVFASFSLFDAVTECAELMCLQASQKGLIFELQFDPSLPEKINSDQNRIKQVLLNLLSNSLKFTDKGSIEIKVNQVNDELIKIDVKDTGCGIPDQNLNKVLEGFGNKQNQKFLNTTGAGLGLSIANNLAMGLGGNRKIEIKSKVNEGTCFSFYILNRAWYKKGCEIKLKDIFNKRLVKWESISHLCDNTIGRTSSMGTQKIVQSSKLRSIKSNNNNHLSNLNQSMDNIEFQTSMVNNGPCENSKYIENGCISDNSSQLINTNTDNVSNYITLTLKPNTRTQNSNTLNNTQKMFTTTLSLLGCVPIASNMLNEIPGMSPYHKNQLPQLQRISEQPAFSDSNYSFSNNLMQQHYPLHPSQLQQQQQQQQQPQLPYVVPKQKNKLNNKILRNAKSIIEYDHTFPQMDGADKDLSLKNLKQIQQGMFHIESCQVIEDQQSQHPIQERPIFRASKNIDFNEESSTYEEDSFYENIQRNEGDQENQQNQFNLNESAQSEVSEDKNSFYPGEIHNGKTNSKEETKISNIPKQQFIKSNFGQQLASPSLKKQNENSSKTIETFTTTARGSVQSQFKLISWGCSCPQILVVDDNDFNLYTITMRLQQYGFTVDKATSGQNAIQKCQEMLATNKCCSKYRAIFMDIDMPIKDGHQTTIEIIKYYKSMRVLHPPITACSAYVQENEKIKAKASGMQYYITKPISSQQLEDFLLSTFKDKL